MLYTTHGADGKTEQHTIPTKFVLWSTGIAMNPFTKRVSDLLPNQVHKRAIVVDAHLRVKGAPLGEVYAIGDCATVRAPPVSTIGHEITHGWDRRSTLRLSVISWNLWTRQTRIKMGKLTWVNGRLWASF